MNTVHAAAGILLDCLYPRRCPICDGILGSSQKYVCRDCVPEVHFIRGAICLQCGKPLEEEEEYCFDCRKRKHMFSRCRAPFLYQGKMKESLIRFKYMGRAEYAVFFGRAMTEFGKEQACFRGKSLLIPVPVHRERKLERGYNQAELLAKEISALTGIPMDGKILRRKKKTKALKSVSKEARSRDLAEAFQIAEKYKGKVRGKDILLIDDIYTTGSTADAASARLLLAGAASVEVLTLAVSPGFS